MAGRVDWAKFVQKIYEAFDKKVNTLLYDALVGADAKVKPAGVFQKTAAISTATTQAQKDTIKETILQLVDDLGSVTGEEVVLIGTKVALAKLDGLGASEWISEGMKQERYTTGRLGLWEGVRKVEIPQGFKDGTTAFNAQDRLVANNKILVMPAGDNKFIKMYDEGDAQIKEVTDGNTNMDATIEYEYQQKMGVATVINKKFGSVTLS